MKQQNFFKIGSIHITRSTGILPHGFRSAEFNVSVV